MKKLKSNLIITAHPDDESIFFAGLVLENPNTPWSLICVTNGGNDGRAQERSQELSQACALLKITHFEQWDFQDQYSVRLNQEQLQQKILKYLKTSSEIQEVFTHGPLGEYGHPHHQDVSHAVHQALASTKIPVWSAAYNCKPEKIVRLTEKNFNLKAKILTEIYPKESLRFIHLLPLQGVEGFSQFTPTESQWIYQMLTLTDENNTSLPPPSHPPQTDNFRYHWLLSLLERTNYKNLKRPF
ncbi:MAG: PIG-L family deacetylase [Bdellovibrionales bacterium]|nr:PIG-L family deacetylase [Bdellovibrionales bacterium]